jgi:hypothetical protein
VLVSALLLVPAVFADIVGSPAGSGTKNAGTYGFRNGQGWSLQGDEEGAGAGILPTISGATATVTTDVSDEHNTVFYLSPQVVTSDLTAGTTGRWMASFVYQVGGTMMADGAAFVIHNDPLGPAAIGTLNGGSGLGYQGIDNSVAIGFNVYSASNPLHIGTGHTGETDLLYMSTALGSTVSPGGSYANDPTVTGNPPFTITGPDPIHVTLTYDQSTTTLTESLMDMTTGATDSYTYQVDIALIVGADARNLQAKIPGTAYVGFTGGTGGSTSVQTISNFVFIENP